MGHAAHTRRAGRASGRAGFLFAAALGLLGGAARADGDATGSYTLDGKESTLTYHAVHKLHPVNGTSRALEGKARFSTGGTVQVALHVPADSFESGNVNRDAHVKEVLEAGRYPLAEVKAVCEGIVPPATFPTVLEKVCKARVALHGTEIEKDVVVRATFESAARVKVTCNFGLSMEAFKIDRPKLMFVKVNDDFRLDASLTFDKK